MFRTSVDEGSYIPTHWHRAVEIIYLLEGKLEVTIESQTFLMQADDCTLIKCKYYAFDKVHTAQHCYFVADSGRIYGIYIQIFNSYFPMDETALIWCVRQKMARFKETLTQMQIANDIRPEGFILRFNSLLFELLFQLLHNFSIQLFHQISVRRTKTVTGWI